MLPALPGGFSHPVKIGTGGFGDVFRARQTALNRLVALKFIKKNSGGQSTLKSEAEMQAGLQIAGIPQIYDVVNFSGKLCIIMQWINGADLKSFLQQPLTLQDRIAIATEIIKITASLHKKGFAHRDIKPENVLISSEGVYLIDFGLSHNKNIKNITSNKNVVKGTFSYIAPELWQGQENVSDLLCADVYSLGRVISEILDEKTMPECVKTAVSRKPESRHGSAEEFLNDWLNSVNIEASSCWRDIAEETANKILAAHLLSSAGLLLQCGKNEEAYQLIVECVQITPDNPFALDMLEKFPTDQPEKRKYNKTVVIPGCIILICIALLTGSYFFNKKLQLLHPQQGKYSNVESKEVIVSGRSDDTIYDKSLPFKEIQVTNTLSGCLYIAGHPGSGHLQLNRRNIFRDRDRQMFSFPTIDNNCIWIDSENNIVWKEVVRVLPFEEKRIWIKVQ
ncbi:MAG: serine/threonine protein kinase [Chitinispirillaceae bacterium]|nr:serine/threonine protein kinase [Chitinispirillaceae bacterium]